MLVVNNIKKNNLTESFGSVIFCLQIFKENKMKLDIHLVKKIIVDEWEDFIEKKNIEGHLEKANNFKNRLTKRFSKMQSDQKDFEKEILLKDLLKLYCFKFIDANEGQNTLTVRIKTGYKRWFEFGLEDFYAGSKDLIDLYLTKEVLETKVEQFRYDLDIECLVIDVKLKGVEQ